MGHPKFTINNKVDRNNFLAYLERNKEAVLSSIKSNYDEVAAFDKKEEFVVFWKKITNPLYIRDTDQDTIWEDTTSLLYMLPDKKIETIKVSLRAKRRSSKSKNKTQLTIDTDVYDNLSSFAKQQKLTLSGALSVLLKSCDEVKSSDIAHFLKISRVEND
jgi:hypothetical protein